MADGRSPKLGQGLWDTTSSLCSLKHGDQVRPASDYYPSRRIQTYVLIPAPAT